MYKLIAIDLDGTLLDDNKNIPEENLKLLKELIDNGYEVVIATGRRYWSAKQLVKNIDRPMVILANNGNIVRDTKDDQIIIKKYLDLKDFKTLIQEGKERGLYPIIHVDQYEEGIDLIIEMDKAHKKYYNYVAQSEERYKKVENYLEIKEDKILAVVYAGSKEKLESFHFHINERYPNRYSSHIMENIVVADALLEIMNPLGCKWLSLSEYAKEKGIAERQIIAIGDDNNDAQMVKNAGCGIAMKNASERVKKVANIITEKDNNESGVAFELRKILDL
ncbi:putative Cof-like hydrolase [[Clostridium] ultunense Esp]|uniref:Putative Cof-like hydrolase n=1 Tax=[Clostridium] ultunense Esp TaxID=1288971 RepID=M1ZMA4_9FIRM|nr:Cof-type HAD-IIB family hydrolase [Schnuerera ultunensis]CCQ98607.1 putative Cof-like hydrolase [[Clostridium] ultunense Esp]SHD77774.1 putative Cof-like hydrolase [[Clostridium] ultunense Esp]